MKDYSQINNNGLFERNSNLNQITISCWNCLNTFNSSKDREVDKCPKCNRFNRVKIANYYQNLNNLEKNIPSYSSEIIINCPFCYTKNLFNNEAEELICYKCAKNIRIGLNNPLQISSPKEETLNNKEIVGWRIVPSKEAIMPPSVLFSSNPISKSIDRESNTDYLLKKILKNIKKQNSSNSMIKPMEYNFYPAPNLFPYPFPSYFGYKGFDNNRNNNLCTSEIRYIPIKTENNILNNKSNNNVYKITIRKKHRREKGISKSTIFEKVFLLK